MSKSDLQESALVRGEGDPFENLHGRHGEDELVDTIVKILEHMSAER